MVQAQIARERDERQLWLIGTQFRADLLLIWPCCTGGWYCRCVSWWHRRVPWPSAGLLQPFLWRRRDELGQLGNALETTRQALAQLFSDWSSKTRPCWLSWASVRPSSQALAHSQRRYQALVDEAPEGIALLNRTAANFVRAIHRRRVCWAAGRMPGPPYPFDAELVACQMPSPVAAALATGFACSG